MAGTKGNAFTAAAQREEYSGSGMTSIVDSFSGRRDGFSRVSEAGERCSTAECEPAVAVVASGGAAASSAGDTAEDPARRGCPKRGIRN